MYILKLWWYVAFIEISSMCNNSPSFDSEIIIWSMQTSVNINTYCYYRGLVRLSVSYSVPMRKFWKNLNHLSKVQGLLPRCVWSVIHHATWERQWPWQTCDGGLWRWRPRSHRGALPHGRSLYASATCSFDHRLLPPSLHCSWITELHVEGAKYTH